MCKLLDVTKKIERTALDEVINSENKIKSTIQDVKNS